jgi:hypothetical protein
MSSAFTSDFSAPGQATTNLLIFGRPKLGKTRAALDVVRTDGHFVILISCDKGARVHLHREPAVFDGKVALAEPRGLVEIRHAIHEAAMKVRKLIKSGVEPGKIWIVVDTLTHMQFQFLQEARKIDQKDPTHEDRKDEDFARDFTTQVDWGINLTLMGEQADMINPLPCNKIYIALEKTDKPKGQAEKAVPALSGQSMHRFTGDADAILHMIQDGDNRVFQTTYAGGGGDRYGLLASHEPVDLIAIYNKIFGVKAPAPKAAEDKQ